MSETETSPPPTPVVDAPANNGPDAASMAPAAESEAPLADASPVDTPPESREVAPVPPEAHDGEPGMSVPPTALAAAARPPLPTPADSAQLLKQLFPALFAGAPKPLKLRIQVDIQQRAPGRFSKQALSAFFRRHTGSTSYLIAVSKAVHRFDLDGQPAGDISAEHREIALAELTRRRETQQSRRELEEQQRRNRAGLLHAFQTTTLTKANFCALKGVAVDELDGLLETARAEAAERSRAVAPRHVAPNHGEDGRRPSAPGNRGADRRSDRQADRQARGPGGAPRRPR